jgi:hypothetical protein
MQQFYVQHPLIQQYPFFQQPVPATASRFLVSMFDPVDQLRQPVTFPFSGRTAKNRFLKSAMSERLATFSTFDPCRRGQPTEELVRLYETWAKGDIGDFYPILHSALINFFEGIIVTGNIQIKKDHLEATGSHYSLQKIVRLMSV